MQWKWISEPNTFLSFYDELDIPKIDIEKKTWLYKLIQFIKCSGVLYLRYYLYLLKKFSFYGIWTVFFWITKISQNVLRMELLYFSCIVDVTSMKYMWFNMFLKQYKYHFKTVSLNYLQLLAFDILYSKE